MMLLLIVTVTSMLLAAIISAIAWRVSGDERRRSEARVVALSAEIHAAAGVGRGLTEPPQDAEHAGRGRNDPASTRPFVVAAGGALVLGAAIAFAIVASHGLGRAPRVATPAAAVAAARVPAPPRPLELVALGHERSGDRLTVRGVIRNPSGAGMDRLTAVVFLLTPDGRFLESGRAAVDADALPPGGESTFVVTVARASAVARYRVSFRTDDRVVPHLDRRHES